MKSMKSAKEYYTPPPKGKHPAIVTLAEAMFSKKGASMIHITVTLEGQYAGEQLEDWAITDGSAKGGGFGKAKLRGLGINVETDADIPDEQVAQSLLNRKVFVEVDHEQSMNKNGAGELVPTTHFDSDTGQTIQIMRAVAKGYSAFNVGTVQAQQTMQPQQYAPPQPQQYAPPQPQQYAPPQQYAGQPPQYAQPGQPLPMAPVQYAQPSLPLAQAPWAGQQQVAPPNGAPAESDGGKKQRRHKIVDSPSQS